MTVDELILELSKHPGDAEVNKYNGDYDEWTTVNEVVKLPFTSNEVVQVGVE